ncbi:MAG: hypothetical protein SFX74_08425 [Fimbriimonadaceae bacterium]|nr:hypothetical protein [Fimbriimonadaceae bacterium]
MVPVDVRHLETYLNDPRDREGWTAFLRNDVVRLVVPALIAVIAWWAMFRRGTWFLLIIGFGAAKAVWESMVSWLQLRFRNQSWYGATRNPHARAICEELRDIVARGSLGKRLHPDVARAADDLARLAVESRELLNNERWRAMAQSGQLREIRVQSLRGIDEAMHDAFLEMRPFLRRVGQRRAEYAKLFDSADAARGAVARIEAMRERLADLYTSVRELGGEPRVAQLDAALANLRELREAQAELDDAIQKS